MFCGKKDDFILFTTKRFYFWDVYCRESFCQFSRGRKQRHSQNLRRESPASILELGLRHEEQISVRKVQNSVLAAQSKLIDTGYDVCPKCGTSSIKRDTRNLIFTLCLRIIKSGYRNINAVILSVIGKVLPQQPLCSAPPFILIWLQCEQGLV